MKVLVFLNWLGRGGVVRRREDMVDAVASVARAMAAAEFGIVDVSRSLVSGPRGTVEFFVWGRRTWQAGGEAQADAGAVGSEPMCDLLPPPSLEAFTDHPGTPPFGFVPAGIRPCGLLPDHVPAHATHFCVHAPFRGAAGPPTFPGLHPGPARFRGNWSQTFGLALVELGQFPSR